MSRLFIHFFGQVENSKQKEMGVENPERLPIDIYIDPATIVSVNESINDNAEVEGAGVSLSSGSVFWVSDSAKEVLNRCGITTDDR